MRIKSQKLLILALTGILIPSLAQAWCGSNCVDQSRNHSVRGAETNSRSFNRSGSHDTRDLTNSNLGYIDLRAEFGNVRQMGVSNSPVNQVYSPVINFGDTQNGMVP